MLPTREFWDIRKPISEQWSKRPNLPYLAYFVILFFIFLVGALMAGFAKNETKLEFLTLALPCLAAVIGGAGVLVRKSGRKNKLQSPPRSGRSNSLLRSSARRRYSVYSFWWAGILIVLALSAFIMLKKKQGETHSFDVSILMFTCFVMLSMILSIVVTTIRMVVNKDYTGAAWWEGMLWAPLVFVFIPLLTIVLLIWPVF